MLDFALARRMMVDSQLRTFDVNDLALLAAMDEIPRERFVPAGREALAYIDRTLPVSDGANGEERRFMLEPMVLARMIQGLSIAAGERVLDVGCALGYSSAVLARLGADVTALESNARLADEARVRLAEAGVADVAVATGPLDAGVPDRAPYDAILVNGAVETRPDRLLDQLGDGGRLVCVQSAGAAQAVLYRRSGDAFGRLALFNATGAPVLPAFRSEPGFVF